MGYSMRITVGQNNRLALNEAIAIIKSAQIHYDPMDASTVTIQTGVSEVKDLGILGYNLQQTTASRQPSYDSSTGYLYFDGVNSQTMMLSTSFTDCKTIMVLSYEESVNNQSDVWAAMMSSPDGAVQYWHRSDNPDDYNKYIYDETYADTPDAARYGTTYLNDTIIDPVSTRWPIQPAIITTIMPSTGILGYFATDRGYSYRAFNGYLGEVLAFNYYLTDEQVQTLINYLKKKWNI